MFKVSGAALLGLMILRLSVASGQTATLTVVQDQQCQGGNAVNVALTALLSRHPHGVQYQRDFNKDGVFDTLQNANLLRI